MATLFVIAARLRQSSVQLFALLRSHRRLLRSQHLSSATVLSLALIAPFLSPSALAQSSGTPDSTATSLAVALPGHVPPQIAAGRAVQIEHYAPTRMIRLAIALKRPHAAEEEAFLRDLQNPKSPNFHGFLTGEEWNARFAPSVADEQAVVAWARSQGFTITNRYANRLLVDVEAPSALIERAFNVTINSYQFDNEVDYSNDRNPTVPAEISGIITGVLGLNNIQRLHAPKPEWDQKPDDYAAGPVFAKGRSLKQDGWRPATNTTGGPTPNLTNGYADPSDIFSSQAYNYNGLYQLGHCCNPAHLASGSPPESSIAIAAWGDWSLSDIAGFQAQYPYLAYNVSGYYIDGQPSGGPNGETLLDTEWSTATANSFGSYLDTAHVYVYMAGSWSQATNSDVFNTMLSNGYARVFTTSWSCTEDTGCSSSAITAWHGIFNSMLAQGWTLMTASGDRGSTDDCYFNNPAHTSVAYPASDPDVVGVGGTSLSLNSDGTWASETGWQGGTYAGACSGNNGGSGGGQSVHFGRPAYQNYYSAATGRLVPDVSLNSGGIGQNFYFNGTLSPTGGTSIASPEMAGFFAQENAYLLAIGNICGAGFNAPCGPYGQPHYALFDEGLNNRSQHNPFYDITSGCNSNDQTATNSLTYYCAHSSYDLVTGWGPSNMMQLAWSLNWERIANSANGVPYLSWSGPAAGVWYNTSQTVSWTVNDYAGTEGPNGTGIAGFTQAWDSLPPDSASEAHGGSGDLFYSGPQYPNAVNGCLSFVSGANGCAGGVSQGCHTAYAIGWNNEGWTTASFGQTYSYGPICYDTMPPVTKSSLSGTKSGSIYVSVVQDTLSATDSSPGSGVTGTVYQINGGTVTAYNSPFTLSGNGTYSITYHSTDVAGNVESTKTSNFTIARWLAETSGTTANLLAISCVSSTKCEIVGSGGLIRGTTNGGSTWSAQTSGTTNGLNGLSCVSTFCVAAGNGGVIRVTTNSGGTWTAKSSGTTANLLGVSCASTTFCVAVGASGKILVTTNGGSTWSSKASGTTNNLTAVSCAGASICKAVGGGGTIRATTNGGTSWSAQTSGTTNALKGVYCRSGSNFCVAVGGSGKIIATTNAGTNWSAQTSGTTQNLNAVSCSSATVCRAVGNAGTVRATTNGGGAWSNQPTTTTNNLFGVNTQSATLAYADGNAGTILKQ